MKIGTRVGEEEDHWASVETSGHTSPFFDAAEHDRDTVPATACAAARHLLMRRACMSSGLIV
jgi:hypothetical protein